MKKRIFLLLAFLFIGTGVGTSTGRKYLWHFAYKTQTSFKRLADPAQDSVDLADLQIRYRSLRDSVERQRQGFYKKYLTASSEQKRKSILCEAGKYMNNALLDGIYPYWYGTTWDFNGITETPRQGQIACGYFVSTTVKHIGVKVNRYKLAQQYSHTIVKSLCKEVKVLAGFETMMNTLSRLPDDLYVVGLDNHVGMISKKGDDIQFIHSSFVFPSYVQSEDASSSPVLASSTVYVLGNMTSNEQLIRSWLMGETVKIVP